LVGEGNDGNVLIVGGEPVIGSIQRVRVTKAHAYDLIGEVEEGGIEASTRAYEASRSSS